MRESDTTSQKVKLETLIDKLMEELVTSVFTWNQERTELAAVRPVAPRLCVLSGIHHGIATHEQYGVGFDSLRC